MSVDLISDIDALLERAQGLAEGDSSRILIRPAFGFDSSIEATRGLVLGGVPSPRLLQREPEGFVTEDRIPYTFTIPRPCLILAESLDGELEGWVPFLDALAQDSGNLLIVTGDTANTGELVRVLLLNTEHRVLRSGIAGLAEGWSLPELARRLTEATGIAEDSFYLKPGESPAGRSSKDLPFGERAYLRRDTSIVLPPRGADWGNAARPIAVFSVGGRYAEDQQLRLLTATERRKMRRQRRSTTRAQLTALPQAPLLPAPAEPAQRAEPLQEAAEPAAPSEPTEPPSSS